MPRIPGYGIEADLHAFLHEWFDVADTANEVPVFTNQHFTEAAAELAELLRAHGLIDASPGARQRHGGASIDYTY